MDNRAAGAGKKLIDSLLTDLRSLSSESKRKYAPVKEASEAAMLKLRTINQNADIVKALVNANTELLQPFVLGCDTKQPKIVHICLVATQRLIQFQGLSIEGASSVIGMLWRLMENGVEELKVLQTAILLLTTNAVVQHDCLAQAIVLCFRLHFTKDSTTINTAAATVRQLVSVVFERVSAEDDTEFTGELGPMPVDEMKAGCRTAPKSLRPKAQDGFMLFQDFCQLVNADQPFWLQGMTEMTRTFGLELMESILTNFTSVFLNHPEFTFLLKERVCPLVIKLFSPSLKYRQGVQQQTSPAAAEKPYFPIVMRLLRIVYILIKSYYPLLTTESEIFLSLLVKFLDVEKPMWQRALALEVIHRIVSEAALLRSFCISYDMKTHSTKIFQDMVNGMAHFIQSQFVSTPTTPTSLAPKGADFSGSPPALVAGMPVGGGISPQPAFLYRGIWIPLLTNIPQGNAKQVFLEMMDKVEPPTVPDGYGLSLAFSCLLDVIRDVQLIIDGEAAQMHKHPDERDDESFVKELNEQLINSSWCGALAAMALLLDASSDESATEAILKSQQTYASLSGKLGLTTPRDAFITSLCKASLPPHYALTILNMSALQNAQKNWQTGESHQDQGERSQVVAVGTALPTGSSSHQGQVMLTAKNIQCMRAILSVAHCHGGILASAWHLVLTTLQHLVWILGLKPSNGGSLKASTSSSDASGAVITTAVMADLPVLSSMLSRLFESSQYLDDVALHHLIDALCKLSSESMELAYTSKEPSLFAVAKLLETGLVNLPRVNVLWKPVTAHLLEVCQHPNGAMRAWGAEAITSLVRTALSLRADVPPEKDVEKCQQMLLAPLEQLSTVPHLDIRQKQLECVLQLLHSNGETLGPGWPAILDIIGAVSGDQTENLIRLAFQSLQLVVTDFLPLMPSPCLRTVVVVASRFGLQELEINISLTSIGLLWNISDFFYQHQEKIKAELKQNAEESENPDLAPFDGLWMCVYAKLGDLCVDKRPPVRKSAGQTLFSTISAHGALLQSKTWQIVLWKVLFPLLEKVKKLSSSASSVKPDSNGTNILIHHSRDTAEKQWAETQVLTLAGVARVFNAKRSILQYLGDFSRAWALLLEFIEASALCRNAEVSLAALKSFQEILRIKHGNEEWTLPVESGKDIVAPEMEPIRVDEKTKTDDVVLWSTAWKVWLSIGTKATQPPETKSQDSYVPSQPFLTALIRIFPPLFDHIKQRFVAQDLQKLNNVLQGALSIPVQGDASPFIIPTATEVQLTALQESVLQAVHVLHKEVQTGPDSMQTMYADLFNQLLMFVEYSVRVPKFGKPEGKSTSARATTSADYVVMNFVPFAEQALNLVVEMYTQTAKHPVVVKEHVLENILKTMRTILYLKYGCPSQSTWMLAIDSLFTLLSIGLPVARKQTEHFTSMWMELALTFEDFLFSKNPTPPSLSVEEYQKHESIDCRVVYLIRDEILPHAQLVPQDFTEKIMDILNRGSIHSATPETFLEIDSSRKQREEFAKACFESLLKFSFISDGSSQPSGTITKLAVTSLLKRCQAVLKKFVADERLSGKCPLPRPRMSEMSSVLKAITTLLRSLKRAPPGNVDKGIWALVIELYPCLIECIASTSPQVGKALREALHEYKDLLAPTTIEVRNGVY